MKPVLLLPSPLRRALLLGTLCAPPLVRADAQVSVRNLGLVLLQPEDQMAERGITVDALEAYVARLLTAADEALRSEFQRRPSGGFIAMAVRTNGRSKAWIDLSPGLPASSEDKLRKALESVTPPAIQSGTLVFGVKLTLWGGSPPTRVAPAPSEWQAQAKLAGKRMEVGELVDLVWPE